jgi:hypothetical protein
MSESVIDILLQVLRPKSQVRPAYDAPVLAGEALARYWVAEGMPKHATYLKRKATVDGLAQIARDPTSPPHRARAAAALLSMGVLELPPEGETP